jgi:hypothetical protein
MFDVKSDERMNAIQTRAGYYAFFCYWGIVLTLAILMNSIEGGVLHDPYFILVAPWFTSMMIFVFLHFRKDFFRTIREEANKSPKHTRETRLRLLLGMLLFAMTMFLLKHFNIFDSETATPAADLLETCVVTAGVGVFLWFTQARKVRERDE